MKRFQFENKKRFEYEYQPVETVAVSQFMVKYGFIIDIFYRINVNYFYVSPNFNFFIFIPDQLLYILIHYKMRDLFVENEFHLIHKKVCEYIKNLVILFLLSESKSGITE